MSMKLPSVLRRPRGGELQRRGQLQAESWWLYGPG